MTRFTDHQAAAERLGARGTREAHMTPLSDAQMVALAKSIRILQDLLLDELDRRLAAGELSPPPGEPPAERQP